MRLMIVGSDKIYAIENFYLKYLRELGVEAEIFTAQNYFYEYYNRSIFNKIMYRMSLSGIIRKINQVFKESIKRFNPEIIWVFKGMEISPGSLIWAKERNIKLVNYNPDNPFIFSGKGSGNSNVTKSIPLYDLHFTYNLEVQRKLETDLHVKTAFLPFGFDLSDELFNICSNQGEILKVCFLGNPDDGRVEFINGLVSKGIKIDVYGNHWERYFKNESVSIHGPVYGDEFWMVLRRYRVQLNLMRIHNLNSHNMRSFEVPGVGGIMLAPKTAEHQILFEDRKQCFLFTEAEDAAKLAGDLLKLPKEEAEFIRQNARTWSLEKGYSYKKRAEFVYGELSRLIG